MHNDISRQNLLIDPSTGGITALLDFDDCIESFLLYDLGRIAETCGTATPGLSDPAAINHLIAAYSNLRPLSDREAALAIDFLGTYAAATGVHVLSNKLRSGAAVLDPSESHPMALFLELTR